MKPWNDALALVASRPHLHLFCDFDGTITPIVPNPRDTVLSPRARDVLRQLVARPRTHVAIVSGRTTTALLERIDVPGLALVGNHGMERVSREGRWEDERATAARPAVARLSHRLTAALSHIEGAQLEQKQISLSLHTKRLTEEQHQQIWREVAALTRDEPTLELTGGKRVLEIRPRGAPHKGNAVMKMLAAAHGAGHGLECAALFLGDDLTDEDAFAEVASSGAGVIVGELPKDRATRARYHATGVDDALTMLETLVKTPSAIPA